LLHEAGSPATMAVMGGRFFGRVIGGSIPVTVAAHWLADLKTRADAVVLRSVITLYT
jgi:hypothetical protein